MSDKINLQQLFIKIAQLFSVFYLFFQINSFNAHGGLEILNYEWILSGFQTVILLFIVQFISDLIQIIRGEKNHER
jgi:hypothetical protein